MEKNNSNGAKSLTFGILKTLIGLANYLVNDIKKMCHLLNLIMETTFFSAA